MTLPINYNFSSKSFKTKGTILFIYIVVIFVEDVKGKNKQNKRKQKDCMEANTKFYAIIIIFTDDLNGENNGLDNVHSINQNSTE